MSEPNNPIDDPLEPAEEEKPEPETEDDDVIPGDPSDPPNG